MSTDILSTALIQSMTKGLSVADLIRTAETLRSSGQIDSVQTLYSTWILHNPNDPLLYAVLFNYSVTLSDAGKLENARQALEQAVSLNPDFLPAHINLGRVYERLGTVGLAIVQWSTVTNKLSTTNGNSIYYKTMALNQSARMLESLAQDEAAEGMLKQSLEIDSHQREVVQHYLALRQRQCEWPIVSTWERISQETLMQGISPLSAAAYTDDPLLQLAIAWNYNKMDVGTPTTSIYTWEPPSTESPRLKIGYVCSDLREHALGHLLAEVFELHNKKNVEVFAYYCGPHASDPLHLKFKGNVDHWTSIAEMDDASAAKKIVDDGIQVLIDLNGYTREGRIKLFAYRPAPVIINWLGYPGTMASPYHHFIIADDWIIPQENEIYYSEKVLRLPCYQPSNRKRIISNKPFSRKDAGLPEDHIVYCCFNGAHKITRFTFERWLLILKMVPKSVLWLLSSTEAAQKRLREIATQFGIQPDRLIFAPKLANPEHLSRYPLADLFLDTTPYGAHTTSSDALWMGVPVLTLSGRSFASRVCGSLVRAAGTPELACSTAEEFIQKAAELGNSPDLLKSYREKLSTQRDSCTLFNMPLLIEKLEALYRHAWEQFKSGHLPKPDFTNLDVYLELGSKMKHDEIEVQAIKDYIGWWKEQLINYNKYRLIAPDHRLNIP